MTTLDANVDNDVLLSTAALSALDMLNSWVRSDSHRGWFSSPRYAIYEWKRVVIEAALKAGVAEYRAVHLTLTCRACGGSGRYTDWNGITYDDCRKCYSRGVVRLEFLETDIQGFRWHTPRNKVPYIPLFSGFAGIWESSSLCTDWEPNGKGRDLTTAEVAEALNILEPHLLRFSGKTPIYDGSYYYDDRDNSKYKLYLGRTDAVCEFCGAVAEKDPEHEDWHCGGCHHHVTRGDVEWSAWACDACKAAYGGNQSTAIFSAFPLPVRMMQDPAIQAWLRRRGANN